MTTRFPSSRFVTEAKVRGSLYDLGAYPGLQLDKGDSAVSGEVYEVDDATLKLLDEFEKSSNYRRTQFEISLGNAMRNCWTYEPDPSFYSFRKLITSGDWLKHAAGKRLRNP